MAFEQEVKLKLSKAVSIVSSVLKLATGLEDYDRRKVAYYAVMTNYIKDFDPFPQMAIAGTPGTGKSAILNILKATCGKVVPITGETITDAALRAAMKAAEYGTLVIEEADEATQRELENTLVTRYSKSSAKHTKMVSNGKDWVMEQSGTFGATIFHRRNLFRDPALLRRVIIVRTKRKRGKYQAVTLDTYPDIFKQYRTMFGFKPTWPEINIEFDAEPAIIDCYRPLITLALLLEDVSFLDELSQEIKKASNQLIEEESYLETQVLLKALITLTAQKVKEKVIDKRINIEVNKIEPAVRDEFGVSCPVLKLSANQRNRILREDLGFTIRSANGRNRIYLDIPYLIDTCEKHGVQDDTLDEWKVALGLADESILPKEPETINEPIESEWETE